MRCALLLAGLVLVVCLDRTAMGATRPATTQAGGANVELTLRGPDGKPVAGKRFNVEVYDWGRRAQGAAHADGETDATGVARFSWSTGNSRMRVSVPGVGYGLTGISEVKAGEVARPALPLLVPWSVVSGTLPVEMRRATVKLKLQSGQAFEDDPAVVTLDQAGHFRAEVRFGAWYLRVTDGTTRLGNARFSVAPGETVEGVEVIAEKPDAPTPRAIRIRRPGEKKTITWVQGTVRDEAGQPLKDVSVFAFATYHGGIRMYERVERATTDARGQYEIKGEGGLSSFSASVVAHAAGRPLGWSWLQPPDRGEWVDADKPAPEPAVPPAPVVDLTLAAAGGRLDVTVLDGRMPAAGAWVMVSLEGVNLRDIWAAGSGGEAAGAVQDLVQPRRQTDANGVGHFDDLVPGTYEIIACTGTEDVRRITVGLLRGTSTSHFGVATGVPVRLGRAASHSMTVYPHAGSGTLRVIGHDLKPLANTDAALEYGPVLGGGGWNTSIKLDGEGLGPIRFEAEGLWRASVKYRDTPITQFPVSQFPYYEARGMMAASALLNPREPVTLTANRVDAAVVEVELADQDGRPAQGVVELAPQAGSPGAYGSTDAGGAIRFEGVATWNYFVRGHLAGMRVVDLGEYESPVPAAAQFRELKAVIAPMIATLPDSRLKVAIRAQSVGFVRGTLQPANGHTSAEYLVFVDGEAGRGARQHYRPSTGEFAAGPFAAGRVNVRVVAADGGREDIMPVREVAVLAGAVSEIELNPPAPRPGARGGMAMIGMGGLTELAGGAARLSGRVVLADGKTPAFGARVYYYSATEPNPLLGGLVDAGGRIQARGAWRTSNGPEREMEAGEKRVAMVVATLPGASGAVVRELPEGLTQPLEMILPKPVALRGRITVGGEAPPPPGGSVRVTAAKVGGGRLAGALAVSTTAQSDGTFELGGLTAGEYEVQAALDDIWLSPAVSVTVGDGELTPIALAIKAPGSPLVVTVVGADGAPARGRAARIERPPGPLGRALWPAEWTTDGAGRVWVPTLERGRHVVHVAGAAEREVEISQPPDAEPVRVRVEMVGEAR